MNIKAIIFDLDGVIVSTDEFHYQAWKRLADEEGIYFDRNINNRLRGVSRMKSLEIILEKSDHSYDEPEKLQMATRKNNYYQELIGSLTPGHILPGVMDFLSEAKKNKLKIAIGSSSKNSPLILKQIGLDKHFDVTVDGNDISRSKPDPEVFLLAAKRLALPVECCLVVEDAEAGVQAALSGGMRVLGVGEAAKSQRVNWKAADLSHITVTEILV
jgi:beta-phosphoglucomutase